MEKPSPLVSVFWGLSILFWILYLTLSFVYSPERAMESLHGQLKYLWSPTNDPVLNFFIDAILVIGGIALGIGIIITGFYLLIILLVVGVGVLLLVKLASISITGTILVAAIIIVPIIFWIVKKSSSLKPTTDSQQSQSYGGYSSSNQSSFSPSPESSLVDEKKEEAEWPWRGKEVIIGPNTVEEKGILGNPYAGEVRESLSGETYIYEGNLLPEKVAKVKEDFWGEPTEILDNEGRKVADIKETFTGRKIIVDENGNEIGEYKEKP